jgi:hypothetical protein
MKYLTKLKKKIRLVSQQRKDLHEHDLYLNMFR